MTGAYGRFTVDALDLPKMFDVVKFREREPELFEELTSDYPASKGNYLYCVGVSDYDYKAYYI